MSSNPYEPPVRAELVEEKQKPRRSWRIPKFDIAMVLLAAFLYFFGLRFLYEQVYYDSPERQEQIESVARAVAVVGVYSLLSATFRRCGG